MGFTNPYPASRLTVDSTNSLVTGMQAWFPLTEGTGTSAQCILHPTHVGSLNGTVSWSSGSLGVDATFGGGYIDTSRDTAGYYLSSTDKATVSFWLKRSSSAATILNNAFGNLDSSNSADIAIFPSKGEFGTYTLFDVVKNGTQKRFEPVPFTNYEYNHFVVVFDGTNCTLYVDGSVFNTLTTLPSGNFANTNGNIEIGGTSLGSFQLKGSMQNVMLWNRALSSTEAQLLFNRPWESTNYGDIWPYSPPASTAMTLSTDTAATSIMADIEGWWVMTDGSGTTLTDISGNGRDATLYGTNTWENETLGTANRFDNSVSRTSHAETANTQPDLTGGYTFSTWVKREDLGSGSNSYGSGIVLGNSSGSSDLEIYFRGNNVAQHPQVRHNQSNGGTSAGYYVIDTNYTDDNNVWVNFVVTYNGSIIKFYRDGVYQEASPSVAAPLSTSGYKIYLNELPVAASNGGLTCSMHNTRLWSRALSDSEISLLHDRPWEGIQYGDTFHHDPPAPASMLPLTSDAINTDQVGWWPLTETDDYASGAADISGSGNNGTQVNGVLSEASRLGGVASFDGVDDNFGMASPIYTHGAVSASAWFKWDGSATFNSILGNYISSTSHDKLYVQYRHDTTTLRAYLGSQNSQVVAATVTLTDWHHIAVTWDLSTAKLYLDGVQIDSVAYSSTSGTQSTSNFTIGDRASDGSLHAGGDIQNVRLWSRALTADEVWSIYANPWLGSNYKLASGSTPLYNYIFRTERFRRLG